MGAVVVQWLANMPADQIVMDLILHLGGIEKKN